MDTRMCVTTQSLKNQEFEVAKNMLGNKKKEKLAYAGKKVWNNGKIKGKEWNNCFVGTDLIIN